MSDQHRMCIDCKRPVPASTFHEHLKTREHREKKMESRLHCGVYLSQIPFGVTTEILVHTLGQYGRVRSCSMNPYTGTAVADFEDRAAAEACLQSPVQVFNRPIQVAPRLEFKQKRIIPPEAGVDIAALISAVETACNSPTTNIEEHIGIVLDFIMLSEPTRDEKIATIVEDLEEHLSEMYPDCRAELFGSAVTGLALPGDAIDISICDGPNRRSVSLYDRKECVVNVHKFFLMNLQHKFASIEEILDAREPMIRFVHNSTRIVCNLVINNTESPKISRRLRWVLCLDERIRPIVLFLKYWAKVLKLVDTTKFSGYMMTLLVLFYLQQMSEAMVPALRVLHDKNIDIIARNITNQDPLRKLIEGFFEFYSEVEVEHVVLSPYMGEVLERDVFIPIRYAIPHELKLYVQMMQDGAPPLRLDTSMVLQDPYELNKNLTSGIDRGTVAQFQTLSKQAYEMVKTGNLLHLLTVHCAPALKAQHPLAGSSKRPAEIPQTPQSSVEINTTFRAARFLQPNYLVPEPKNEVVLTKKELFQRWLNVMFVILPDFLTNFVRLQVLPQPMMSEPNFWEPRAKAAKLSGKDTASRWNAAGKTSSNESMTRRWLCQGRPVVCSWQQRKKAAAELELTPSIHPMEREVLISKHLEQTFQTGEVSFYFILKVDEDKEMLRVFFENCDVKTEPYSTVAHALVILLPLWINNAFEVGFSLRCVTGVYIPGDMHIGASEDSAVFVP